MIIDMKDLQRNFIVNFNTELKTCAIVTLVTLQCTQQFYPVIIFYTDLEQTYRHWPMCSSSNSYPKNKAQSYGDKKVKSYCRNKLLHVIDCHYVQ